MIMIDDVTALVYDTDDLRDAVSSDNGVEYVYFGADITLAYGITIFPNKPSLTFNGTFEGVTYTFTDMNSPYTTDTLGVRSVSDIVIIFEDINLIGHNYYGIPYVPNGSNYNNVSTIYKNVTYSGAQINHNPYGFTRFVDCNITVNSNEVAEASRIEIGGETTMVKTNTQHSVFWIYGDGSQRTYLRILAGANVTITTANYFIYEHNPPDIIIEPGASLSLSAHTGIGSSGSHTINSVLVDENASFRFIQATGLSPASICIDGTLTVNSGATFYMQANFQNSYPLIRFTRSTGGLYVNNPKSFVLYNRGGSAATAFYFASTVPIALGGGQVNFWNSATSFPEAGTFEDRPAHKWNRPGYGMFRLQGTASNSATNITFNDFTPEELAELDPLSDLQLDEARVLSIGQIPLQIYSAVVTRSVTGATEPQANVRITLIPSYYDDPHTSVAGNDGRFTIVPSSPVPFSDHVEVFSNTPFLIVSSVMAVQEEDVLYIDSAPVLIDFPLTPMPEFPGIILPRDEENALSPVVIIDTYAVKEDWQLWANISGPLITDENDVLPDAVVFGLENGELVTLQTQFIAVHTGRHEDSNSFTVTWDMDKGVLARITAPIRSGKRYTTKLGWAVTPAGIPPEEVE